MITHIKEPLTTGIVRIQVSDEADPHPAHYLRYLEVRLGGAPEWILRHDSVIPYTKRVGKDERDLDKVRDSDSGIHAGWEHVEVVAVLSHVVLS